jgi:hypothetical protein
VAATYRFFIATDAKVARNAVDHCPVLPAGEQLVAVVVSLPVLKSNIPEAPRTITVQRRFVTSYVADFSEMPTARQSGLRPQQQLAARTMTQFCILYGLCAGSRDIGHQPPFRRLVLHEGATTSI